MEQNMLYVASLDHILGIGRAPLILKEVTDYLRTNPSGITVRNLIDYLLINEGDFGTGWGYYTKEVCVRGEESFLAKTDTREDEIHIAMGIKNYLKELEEDPDNLFLGISMTDSEGNSRPMPDNLQIKSGRGTIDFLIDTAPVLPLFESYQFEGSDYMGLNLRVTGIHRKRLPMTFLITGQLSEQQISEIVDRIPEKYLNAPNVRMATKEETKKMLSEVQKIIYTESAAESKLRDILARYPYKEKLRKYRATHSYTNEEYEALRQRVVESEKRLAELTQKK